MPESLQAPSTTTWDGAASPGATGRVRKFEAAWTASCKDRRPDPRDFLPENAAERSAVLLALLRSDIGLRWDAGERVEVETYRERYPELDLDGLVALIYEEFCLREEAGDAPTPIEFEERFPDLTHRLRRVFDIHELVGTGGSAAFRVTSAAEVPFPESGQTTAGFRLIEELGRGSFARVFLAEERQLADRPVALKVSRTGSREPQTLARLQHTHIVPVHSHRIDQATGLHLLCMPYFGRVTLERLLADPALRTAGNGADVLATLDRLSMSGGGATSTARSLFSRLPYARAMAWWGARMAEALAHAHERGVLHRDVKPSNVLVTSDGLPMLLDFNLAREPRAEAVGSSLGGTLAYMAPEHIEALAHGNDAGVDGRSDVFSLGVLLFETLTGRRPFPSPVGASSVAEALHRAAETRRATVVSIRETHPEVPPAMESVVLKCLAADPSYRYADACALAIDLQAVADDAPLVHAREPFGSRSLRWSRRHRRPLILAGVTLLTWLILAQAAVRAREDQKRVVALLAEWVEEGVSHADEGRLGEAVATFNAAVRLVSTTPDYASQPPLVSAKQSASEKIAEAELAIRERSRADSLFETAQSFRAVGPSAGDVREAVQRIDDTVRPFVSGDPSLSENSRLDPGRKARAGRDVRELLYRRALLGRTLGEAREQSMLACVIGSRSATDKAPWKALLDRLVGAAPLETAPEAESAESCLLYAILAESEGNAVIASDLLKRASRLDPDDPGIVRRVESAAIFEAKARRRQAASTSMGSNRDRSWDHSVSAR